MCTCRPLSIWLQYYQRGSERRRPPPPPYPPDPADAVFGRASLTVRLRPPSEWLLRRLIAFLASSSDAISTNANPRARPVAMSRIRFTLSTVPASANRVRRSWSLVSNGRLPTKSFLAIPEHSFPLRAAEHSRHCDVDPEWIPDGFGYLLSDHVEGKSRIDRPDSTLGAGYSRRLSST